MNDEIIYEDVNSEEYLTEMAMFKTCNKNNFGLLLTVGPGYNKGNPYFKIYNNSKYDLATEVIRISFLKPFIITGHIEIYGKKEWISHIDLNFKKKLVKYLNSNASFNPRINVWTMARYYWNDLKIGSSKCITDYISGKDDTPENLKNPDYIPYNMQMPNYLELR